MTFKLITCALRWGVAFVGITLLGVAHPIWDNPSSVGHAPVGVSHSGPESMKKSDL